MEDMNLTEEQRLYLQYILDYWRKNNKWPTHQYLDGVFYEKHLGLDVEKIGKSLSFTYTNQPDFHRTESEATLTLPAIYLLDKNAPELATFLKILHICVAMYSPSSDKWIGNGEILGPILTWDDNAYRSEFLLRSEPHIWQSSSSPDQSGNWGGKLDRLIRRFRNITTIEEYLEKRNPFYQAESVPNIPEPVATDIYVEAQCRLHPDIYERCWERYNQGDYDNAILNATKAIEVAVRKKSNLPDHLAGANLMGQAFGTDNPKLLYSAVKSEQDGMMSLLKGIIGVYKNPQSHRFVGTEDQSACLGVILMCSNLLFTIESFENGTPEDEPAQ